MSAPAKTGTNRAERALALLEQRYPGWVSAVEFEKPCGRQAWRTAIAEARAIVKGDGHDIENRTRRQPANNDGGYWTLSEYRLKKASETEPVAAKPHDLNVLTPNADSGRLW
jgi:hypothetical protein